MPARVLSLLALCWLAVGCVETISIASHLDVRPLGAPDDILVLNHTRISQMPFVPFRWSGYQISVTVPASEAIAGNTIDTTDPGVDILLDRLGPGPDRLPDKLSGTIEILTVSSKTVEARIIASTRDSSWSIDRRIRFDRRESPSGGRTLHVRPRELAR